MRIATQRKLLWISAVGLLGAGAAIAVGLCAAPPQASSQHGGTTGLLADVPTDRTLPLAQYQDLWSIRLQGPVFDPPPAAAAVVKRKPFGGVLTGIAAEDPADSLAFLTYEGKTLMLSPGDRIGSPPDQAEVVSIKPGVVELKYHDESLLLTLEKNQ